MKIIICNKHFETGIKMNNCHIFMNNIYNTEMFGKYKECVKN